MLKRKFSSKRFLQSGSKNGEISSPGDVQGISTAPQSSRNYRTKYQPPPISQTREPSIEHSAKLLPTISHLAIKHTELTSKMLRLQSQLSKSNVDLAHCNVKQDKATRLNKRYAAVHSDSRYF